MKLRKNIATSTEGFIFNPATGDSFTTNTIGAEIIGMLKEAKTTKDIIDSICLRYNIEPMLFERDLDDFIAQLKEYRIVEN